MMTDGARVFLALTSGLLVGVALRELPPAQREAALQAVEPFGTLWVNALRVTVLPLIVSTLVAGIAVAGRATGRRARHAFFVFGAMVAAAGVFAALTVPLLLPWLPVSAEAIDAYRTSELTDRAADGAANTPRVPGVNQFVTSLIPPNVVAAAAQDAVLPIIIFAIAFAFALGRTPEANRATVVTAFETIAAAMLILITWILALAPVAVFILASSLAARAGLPMAGLLAGYVATICVLVGAFTLLIYPVTVVLGGITLKRFAASCLPAQAVAIASRSSIAALPAMLKSAETVLAISPPSARFLLPLAVSLQKVALPISITTGVLFLATIEGTDISAAIIATTVVAATALSFAVPGIPSGSVLMMVPILDAVGVSSSGIGLLLAVDLLPDLFKTAAHVTADMSAVAIADRWTNRNLNGI